MKNKIEILAPCGSFESVTAAVRSGADAVYLGAKDFSARAGAQNFDYAELKTAADYCRIRGVKVYLTVNTVVFDSELAAVKDLIVNAAKAGVDALIVQSMGVARLAKQIAPDLPLHASTQMSIHSPSGAKLLYEEGFNRVVLARELSRSEITQIAQSCPNLELEVFVHGALCMSVSGQCYFSAVIGSRSGNRGRCAQTCRLPFTVDGKHKYALSLKDNSIIEYIRDLQEIGVASAKIEGRLKRPEYVSAAVKACVEARDIGAVDENTKNQLESVFSRTGFTNGYYTSKRGYEMFGFRQKEDVVSATSKLLSDIRNGYKDEAKRVNLRAEFTAKAGFPPELLLTDGKSAVTVKSAVNCEKAVTRALDDEAVKKQLLKTGGTPYSITNLQTDIDEGVSLPVSALNNLRREALDKLSELRADFEKYTINDIELPRIIPHKAGKKRAYARFTSTKIGDGFKDIALCWIPLDSGGEQIKNLLDRGFKIGVEIPRALFSREEKVRENLERVKALGIKDALCGNLAAVRLAKSTGMVIHGGFGLNFTNTYDLLWAEEYGFFDTELSFELKTEQIEKLGGNIARGIITYGYLPVMLTRNCPNKSADISCKNCGRAGKMKDRLGKTFIFYCDGYAAEILNELPLDAVKIAQKSENIDFGVFRFSVENYVEKVERIPDFIGVELKNKEKTHGLYIRGVK